MRVNIMRIERRVVARVGAGLAVAVAWLGFSPIARGDETVTFTNDVMAVLSKAGCNQGTCHGNLNGKGGFKLSLRGEDPAADFTALSRDALGRRTTPNGPTRA
jgi:mono/diheme cytochrome c family protein